MKKCVCCVLTRFYFEPTWFIYHLNRRFNNKLGWRDEKTGADGKLKRDRRNGKELTWPRFDEREFKKITIVLVPTTMKENKSLFNISKTKKKTQFYSTLINKTKRRNKKGPQQRRQCLCKADRKYAPRQKPSSFYLMGAAAVMHPRGPHFNNWTDNGAAPAGSPNHRHGFEQTAVTLQRGARQHSAEKYGQEGWWG